MRIIETLCDSGRCNLECIEACQSVYGYESPLRIEEGSKYPVIVGSCTNCLRCVRACPFSAIATDMPIEKTEVVVKCDTPSGEYTPPYEVSDDYEYYSEANMIFARVRNDPSFQYYGKDEWSGGPEMIARGIPGYSYYEHEMAQAGWKLYDERVSVSGPLRQDAEKQPRSDSGRQANPNVLTQFVKNAARFFGANLVGIAPVDRRWIYSADRHGEPYEIPESFNRAIVMAIEMDYEGISTSPSFPSSVSTAVGYSKMAFIEIELSAYIRKLGFRAIPCGNDISLSVPLAIDAGLGMYGRHGLLITKKFGPRVRIAKILTDMPLLADKLDYGFCKAVTQFCETCEKCSDHCPSKSIPYGKEQTWNGPTRSNNPGVKKWYVNPETCYGFWTENGSDCSNCIRSCPYNKKDGFLHRSVLWVVRHLPWLNRLVLFFDNLMGYGTQESSKLVWTKFRN
ncbi:MAG: reductive dehalogenase [Candidatus Hodarchaeota archaeon]